MAKVIIYLQDHESAALQALAQREYRATKAQAALIIRKQLERLGLIPGETTLPHSIMPGDNEKGEA